MIKSKKQSIRKLMPKRAGGTRPTVISDDLLKKLKNIIMREKKTPDLKRKIGEMMSPGRVRAITGKNPGEMKKPSSFIERRSEMKKPSSFTERRKRLTKPTGRMSKADMTRAAGMGAGKGLSRVGGVALSKAVFNQAKKLKPSGRLNVDDIKRAKDMLKKRKGK
jgi:hypothetical protein